ncbi:hypothetical protein MauCBS54593_006534 [Microsporum audouinii]
MDTFGRVGAFHKNGFLGPGIASSDGPAGNFLEIYMIKPLFKKGSIRSTAMFRRHVDCFIAQILRDGSTIDVQPFLKKMNSITRTSFKGTMLPKGGGPYEKTLFPWRKTTNILFLVGVATTPSSSGEKTAMTLCLTGGTILMCPLVADLSGYQQVYLQSVYVLIRLTQEFESIENRDPVMEYVELDGKLIESRNGIKIGLTAAGH